MADLTHLSPDEAQRRWRDTWTEGELQGRVEALLLGAGWLVAHVRDARRQRLTGLPDVIAVHPTRRRLLALELKTRRGRVTPEQQAWLDALAAAGVEARVVRPADWPSLERDVAGAATEREAA